MDSSDTVGDRRLAYISTIGFIVTALSSLAAILVLGLRNLPVPEALYYITVAAVGGIAGQRPSGNRGSSNVDRPSPAPQIPISQQSVPGGK